MDNKIEMAVVPENNKIVNDASISRKLLKDGYRIVDIKPKKGHERETVLIFRVEGDFMNMLSKYIEEKKAKRVRKDH